MKNNYYLIKEDYAINRVKVVVELDDYVGFMYNNGRYVDEFERITYRPKTDFLGQIIKNLGTNPEWSADEILYDDTRSIS